MNTKAQARKDELLADLIETRGKIIAAASALSPEKRSQVFLGIWSVQDLLAHLVGWDIANLEAAKAVRAGKLPEFYAFIDKDWRTYNAHLVATYKKAGWEELVSSAQASHRELLDYLATVLAAEFEQDWGVRYKGYKVTIARLLQAELKDEKVHHTQIETFFAQ
jgi:uncharacterized damage-inducible protein DinB